MKYFKPKLNKKKKAKKNAIQITDTAASAALMLPIQKGESD